jgi:small subunit ribosomal protein S2
MAQVDIKALLDAGAHFGHKTSRWHPKMAANIHSKRGENHIINLERTVEQLEDAIAFVAKVTGEGKQVLFVGTKRQAKDVLKAAAIETGMPYVTERWLGGMLTNSTTINGRVKHLKDLEAKMASGELAAKYNKLEVQRFQEEIDLMNHIVDLNEEDNAVREATKLGIPVVAIVDTNADPSKVQYPIAANDDAIKSVALITDYLKDAINAGKAAHAKKAPAAEATETK